MNYLESKAGRAALKRYLSGKSPASMKVYKSEVVQFFGWLTEAGIEPEAIDAPVIVYPYFFDKKGMGRGKNCLPESVPSGLRR